MKPVGKPDAGNRHVRFDVRLIKLWLKAPVEERDSDGKRRMTGGKNSTRGTPQGGVAAPRTQKITSDLSERFWAGAGGACLI